MTSIISFVQVDFSIFFGVQVDVFVVLFKVQDDLAVVFGVHGNFPVVFGGQIELSVISRVQVDFSIVFGVVICCYVMWYVMLSKSLFTLIPVTEYCTRYQARTPKHGKEAMNKNYKKIKQNSENYGEIDLDLLT